jgi:hypothetical protein
MDKTRFMFGPVATAFVLAAATSTASAEDARDYIDDAKVFYRVVSCGAPETPVPAGLDQKTVDAHCAIMAKTYEYTKTKYIETAQKFFANLRPTDVPTTVVYPFGGGDLLSALVTYPDAKDITTISLEHAGDPTRVAKMTKKAALKQHLAEFRAAVDGLLRLHDSTSENMMKLEVGGIPGQLSFHITGLMLHGYEPVSLKYFTINDDGTLHYLTQTEIDGLAKKKAKKLRGKWVDTDFSEAFNNMELTFRKVGDAKAPLVTHRHIAWSLDDKKFKESPLQKHLVAKGKIAAMTKAASFLLWNNYFSGIRDYLLDNMVWMASDATGVPPKHAKKKGFTQTTYGVFKGAFLDEYDANVNEQMVELWDKQPKRKLPFRYGYPDNEKHVHMMITAPAPKKIAPEAPKEAPKSTAPPARGSAAK